MKTKLTAFCTLAMLLLIISSTAEASQIIDLRDYNDNQVPFPPPTGSGLPVGPNFFPGGQTAGYLIDKPDWGWTHTFEFASSGPPSIISATLEIKQFGVLSTDQHQIYIGPVPVEGENPTERAQRIANSISVGFLDNRSPAYPDGFPYELTHTTVFNLDATMINKLLGGTVDMWIDIDWPNTVAVYSSKLIINYIPAGLDYIEVSGPAQVNENSSAQYTCTAYFIDSSSTDVTNSAVWTQNSPDASIGTNGLLTTFSVLTDQAAQVKASFGDKTDTLDITIKNIPETVSITAPSPFAAEPSFNGLFEVSRTGLALDNLRVYYTRSGSTATTGIDYMDLLGYVDIPAGKSSVPISVIVIDDNIEEPNEIVKLRITPDASYVIDPALFTATVTIADNEPETPPVTSGHIPAKNSIQVARDTIIQLHITDGGSGVEYDGGTVTIRVEGDLIYDGADETSPGVYDSTLMEQTVKGICRRVGTEQDYLFVFQPSDLFGYEQQVDVEVSATDKAGHLMTESYSFYTLMRTFGKNIRVNTDTGKLAQNHPDSATDTLGNIWVVWEHVIEPGDADIYIGKLPAGGGAFEPNQVVFSDLNNQIKPAIAIDGNNKIYVVWQGNDPSGFWDVFLSASMDGTNWSSPHKLSSNDPLNKSNQTSPAIAIDRNNQVYIAWEDNSKGESDKDIWAVSSIDDIWLPAPVATQAHNQTEPVIDITTDITEVPYVIWTDARTGTGTDIYGSKNFVSEELLVNTYSNQSSPSVAISDGTIHLLWIDDYHSIDNVFYGNDGAGLPITGTTVIDEPGKFQSSPSIAANGSNVFACWEDARNVLSNLDTDIYFTESSGSGFGTNILVNDDIGTFTQRYPDINTDMDGNPFIVWVDNRKGNNDIYAAAITSTGSVLKSKKVKYLTPNPQIVQINEDSDEIDDVDDITILIPGGALAVDTEIRISKFNNPPDPPAGAFGVFYDLSPGGFEFLLPVTVTIPHSAADCPGYSEYRVYFFDPSIPPPGSPWSREGITNVQHVTDLQDSSLPTDVHIIRFNTTHFTAFGVGGGAPIPVGGGGGGGGGGGCSVSAAGEGNFVEFILPYIGFFVVLVILSVRDSRVRKIRSRQ